MQHQLDPLVYDIIGYTLSIFGGYELSNVEIRTAVSSDALGIAHILCDAGLFSDINAEPFERTARRVRRAIDECTADHSHTVYVAVVDGSKVVGYATVHWSPYLFLPAPEGFLGELFVLSQWRGCGVGSALLASVRAEAEQRGCSRLMLINSRDRESYRREYYPKHGWVERPEFANFVLRLPIPDKSLRSDLTGR